MSIRTETKPFIKTIFFDLDDTLYDRSIPFINACRLFFDYVPKDPYQAYLSCNRRGNEVFHASQRGKISMDEMYIHRYCRGFEDVGIFVKPEEALIFQNYYKAMHQKITCTETAVRILEICRSMGFRLGMITNGPSDKQRGKIECLGIGKYFCPELIIVSGEVGTDKPDPAIFRLAENRCGIPAGELFYIGDSFSQDIVPASEAGWKTVWFNRRKAIPSAVVPKDTAVVGTEEELCGFLEKLSVGDKQNVLSDNHY